MDSPLSRFFSDGRCFFGSPEDPETDAHCNVWDWDQLRMIKVKGTAKILPCDEESEIPLLARFVDYLSPEVRAVSFDDNGLLNGISTDPREDDTVYIPHLSFSSVESLANTPIIYHSKLQEIARLGPGVDLSQCNDGPRRKVVFKFDSWGKAVRHYMSWKELHILKSMPPHPNLVPFDSIVLEDQESRIIGFTTKYISGGTFEDLEKPFRLEWLNQLTKVVDFLNLDLGIMHQDIAPRNLLLDPETDEILLFDFDVAASGDKDLQDGRDDVSGVVYTVYELITNDTRFSKMPHWERNMDMVQNITEWPRKRDLDADVSAFRDVLNRWIVTKLTSDNKEKKYLNLDGRITWPDQPTPPEYSVPFQLGETESGEPNWVTGPRSRQTALGLGQYCFRWERPPQSRLLKKINEDTPITDGKETEREASDPDQEEVINWYVAAESGGGDQESGKEHKSGRVCDPRRDFPNKLDSQ